MAHERVLLVDDEIEFTDVLAERMQSRGFNVDTAGTGREALEMVQERTYDAVILDLQMPELDGMETLKQMRDKNPSLQIILLTGHATVEKGVEAVKLGAMDFLEKPVDIVKLIEKITEASHKRMLLIEQQTDEEIQNILKTKGW